MRAIAFAYNEIGHRGLQALIAQGFEVAAVFTHPDDPDENRWFPSVAELAAEHGIPVFAPDDVAHPLWIERLRGMQPDMLFSFYYRKLLAPEVLELAPRGAFNLHGSLLPKYRGRCPLNWVLVNGERETGVTLHHMTARADAGDIVDQLAVPIAEEDDAPALARKLGEAATALLERALPALLDGSAGRVPQDEAQATKFGGRRPADGEIDWTKRAGEVRDLVRAVAAPWPGAFTHVNGRRVVIWKARASSEEHDLEPGTVVREEPLAIACGEGSLEVVSGQPDGGVTQGGVHLGRELALVEGTRIGRRGARSGSSRRKKRVLILGSDGFIGSHLSDRLLSTGRYELSAIDLNCRNTSHLLNHPDYRFFEGDIGIHREWIEYHVKKADVVLPLVAIATPIEYVRNPLKVFELDFERNLEVVRYCVKYEKRLIFPSTSEVYGMCEDDEFDEERSNLVLGPIHRQRWIYSCIKQLLDRVIWAHGQKDGLRFTLFRPFNWIGPRLDSLDAARIGSSRAITQLVLNLVEGTPMLMIDGGAQMRCFTDVSDGIEGLFRIIDDDSGGTDGRIVNIGAPENEASIKELAELLIRLFEEHPLREHFPPTAGLREIESEAHYGKGYEDVRHRRPSITNARKLLDWEPREGLESSVARTLDHFLRQTLEQDVDGVLWPVAPPSEAAPRARTEQPGAVRTERD